MANCEAYHKVYSGVPRCGLWHVRRLHTLVYREVYSCGVPQGVLHGVQLSDPRGVQRRLATHAAKRAARRTVVYPEAYSNVL